MTNLPITNLTSLQITNLVDTITGLPIDNSVDQQGGFAVAQMNTSQRDNLLAFSNGAIIYNTDSNLFNLYQNGGWAILNNTISGQVTLGGGTVVVPAPAVTANSNIILTYGNPLANSGTILSVSAITPGASFSITSNNNADTSRVNYFFSVNNNVSGRVQLANSTAIVNTPLVTANSNIMLTYTSIGGALTNAAVLRVSAITAGTSFAITSSGNNDTSFVNWFFNN
jgi:hypothetical protein